MFEIQKMCLFIFHEEHQSFMVVATVKRRVVSLRLHHRHAICNAVSKCEVVTLVAIQPDGSQLYIQHGMVCRMSRVVNLTWST